MSARAGLVLSLVCLSTPPAASSVPAAPAAATQPAPAERISKALEAAELLQQALGFKLKPSAFIATNVVFNTGAALPSADAPFFVKHGSRTIYQAGKPWEGDGTFLVTARQSRFGAETAMQLHRLVDARGVFEFDLWALHLPNIPPGITAGTIRLRQAFMEVGHKHLKLRAGQDLSVIAPRYPFSTGHLAVAAFTQAGFLWQRLPQVTMLASAPLNLLSPRLAATQLFAHVSIARPHSGDADSPAAIVFDVAEPGSQSLLPLVQWRFGLDSRFVTVGTSGQAGVENHALTDATGKARARKLAETWLVAADAQLKADAIMMQGQAWVGSNVNGMFGMTGVVKTPYLGARDVPVAGSARDVDALRAVGGWVQGHMKAWPGVLEVFAGAGFEHTLDVDKVKNGTRVTNAALQLGMLFPVHKHLDFGVEAYHVASRFKGDVDPHAWNDNLMGTARLKL